MSCTEIKARRQPCKGWNLKEMNIPLSFIGNTASNLSMIGLIVRSLNLSAKQNPEILSSYVFVWPTLAAVSIQWRRKSSEAMAGITVRGSGHWYFSIVQEASSLWKTGPCLEIEDLVWKPMISGSADSKSPLWVGRDLSDPSMSKNLE